MRGCGRLPGRLRRGMPRSVLVQLAEAVDDGCARTGEGRKALRRDAIDEGLPDGGGVAWSGRLDGGQALLGERAVGAASFRAALLSLPVTAAFGGPCLTSCCWPSR